MPTDEYEIFLADITDDVFDRLGMAELKATDPRVQQLRDALPTVVDATLDALIVVFNAEDAPERQETP